VLSWLHYCDTYCSLSGQQLSERTVYPAYEIKSKILSTDILFLGVILHLDKHITHIQTCLGVLRLVILQLGEYGGTHTTGCY
jgi:hypothetical protein